METKRDVKVGGVESTRKDLIEELENRYIKVLEAKIERLESLLGKDSSGSEAGDPKKVYGVIGDDEDVGAEPSDEVSDEATSGAGEKPAIENETREESRYIMVESSWDMDKGEFVDRRKEIKDDKAYGPEPKSHLAFTFRKTTYRSSYRIRLSAPDHVTSSEVDIHFPALQLLLGDITSRWGWGEKVTKCVSPYTALIYSWGEARALADTPEEGKTSDETQARNDLRELMKIIETSSGNANLGKFLKDRSELLNDCTMTHSALWTLFAPGTLVVTRPCNEQAQVMFVDSCDGFVERSDHFSVVCNSYDWNGNTFNRVPFVIKIPGWGGDRKSIVELPVYPLKYHREESLTDEESVKKLKEELILRGKQFFNLCTVERGKQMFKYRDGPAYFTRTTEFMGHSNEEAENMSESQSLTSKSTSEYGGVEGHHGSGWKSVSGAMIVDFSSYLSYQSPKDPILGSLASHKGSVVENSPEKSKPVFQNMYRFNWDGKGSKDEMSDEQLLCFPPRVLGYSLKLKTWVQLLVDNLRPPDDTDSKTFEEKLQLDHDAKDLINKTVKAHELGRKQVKGKSVGLDDFAPEKGRGLVIMLYGSPGVGKTLTAESVAQMTGKPLLSVGVSDIGIEGDKVEVNLQKVFALAGLWEAVLLFDEADVFLEARGEGDNDLRRNAMVSVLLRVLEYYEGILILTTNRMRSLDIAVQSRIHLAIKFVDLQPQQKVSIYESFFEQLADKNQVENLRDLIKWATKDGKRLDFNGRQIRNVVSTALSIALANDEKLNTEHLAMVARQTDEFKRDLSVQEGIYKDKQIRN